MTEPTEPTEPATARATAGLDGGRLSEWVTSSRPGAGVRAWAPGTRWSHSVRGEWGRGL